ncbi:MAG: DUF4434 domain-containing protein [Armatimonadota bacterium]
MDNNIDSRRMCSPAISGPLWYLDPAESVGWSIDQWENELDEQRELGFDLLWLLNSPVMLDIPDDPLGKLLDLCAQRKVQVILDTGWSPKWYEPFDLNGELEMCSKNVKSIGERFAGHSAFYAWYIPQEIYMCWDEFAEYIDAFYPAIVERCKKSVQLPVTLSPFFILDKDKIRGDYRYPEPEEYGEYWANLIKRSGFDIIILQDSGEHFSFVTMEQRKPFFEAMSFACNEGGARLWGNVETAEVVVESYAEYVRRFGQAHQDVAPGVPWRPVPIDRLKDKLELAAEYSERIVSWGYREYGRPAHGSEAKKWYEDYRNYIQLHRGGIEEC